MLGTASIFSASLAHQDTVISFYSDPESAVRDFIRKVDDHLKTIPFQGAYNFANMLAEHNKKLEQIYNQLHSIEQAIQNNIAIIESVNNTTGSLLEKQIIFLSTVKNLFDNGTSYKDTYNELNTSKNHFDDFLDQVASHFKAHFQTRENKNSDTLENNLQHLFQTGLVMLNRLFRMMGKSEVITKACHRENGNGWCEYTNAIDLFEKEWQFEWQNNIVALTSTSSDKKLIEQYLAAGKQAVLTYDNLMKIAVPGNNLHRLRRTLTRLDQELNIDIFTKFERFTKNLSILLSRIKSNYKNPSAYEKITVELSEQNNPELIAWFNQQVPTPALVQEKEKQNQFSKRKPHYLPDTDENRAEISNKKIKIENKQPIGTYPMVLMPRSSLPDMQPHPHFKIVPTPHQ